MIPYLAIVKDSFRAALQSYTLWTLFVVVTMMLIVILPFGYTEMLTGRVGWREVRNWPAVLDVIYEQQQADEPNPGKHIWSLLSKPLRSQTEKLYEQLEDENRMLQELGEDEKLTDKQKERIQFNAQRINTACQILHAELDEKLLEQANFYDKQAWADLELSEEAKELLALPPSELTERKLRRRNRLLLEAAFPILVPRSPPLSVRATYGSKPLDTLLFGLFPRPDGNTKDAVIEWYRGYIGVVMEWPSGLLVFVAIIATANIIPRMFEPGSITLLLSKPIGRSRLFLAQFLGACAFMLLVSIYFTVGVWLIAGLRLSIWNPAVFLCIPLFTFQFMVYFAVSAYFGIVYRSPVVSVLATVVFYYLCLGIGWAKVTYDDSTIDAARLVHVVDTGDMLVSSNDPMLENVRHFTYDTSNEEWKDIFQGGLGIGSRAVYDPNNDQLLAIDSVYGMQFLAVGRARDAWVRKRGAMVPPGTIALLVEPDGNVLAVSRFGFFRLTGEALVETKERAGRPGDVGAAGAALGGLALAFQEEKPASGAALEQDPRTVAPRPPIVEPGPTGGGEATPQEPIENPTDGNSTNDAPTGEEPQFPPGFGLGDELGGDEIDMAISFTFVGPDKLPPVEPPMAVAIDPSNSRIVVYANGEVAVYDRNEKGEYTETARRDLPDGQEKTATVASAGSAVVIARDDGKVFILDPKTLDTIDEFSPEGEVAARFAVASNDGQWVALLFHNRKLWLYNTLDKKLTKANVWTQGDISAVNFSGNNLLIVDRIARVREIELPSMKEIRTLSPEKLPYLSETYEIAMFGMSVETNMFTFYRWVIVPIYTILPKPGELGWAMNYMATGEQTELGLLARLSQRGESSSDERHKVRDPWRGVRSCSLFVIFMLVLCCWRVSRSEF